MDQGQDAVDIALRAAERLYDEEEARFRHSEQKGTALLAVAGVLLTVFSRTGAPESLGSNTCISLAVEVVVIGTVAALFVAFVYGLAGLRPRTEFQRVKPADLAGEAVLSQQPSDLKKFLLQRYTESILVNAKATERKLNSIRLGFAAVLAALSLMLLRVILRAVQ